MAESINWGGVSALAGNFWVVAVAALLVFVGLRIMRNTQATKVATVRNIMSALRASNFQVSAGGDFSKILYNGWIHTGIAA